MKAVIITIGDELLNGQTLDTNSAWIGQRLGEIGISVLEKAAISDSREHIFNTLDRLIPVADVILITGGLGPTKDDLTKLTLADYFKMDMRTDAEVLTQLESWFAKRNLPMLDRNRDQAKVPSGCRTIFNARGTAPGMWFDLNGKTLVSMPGVPHEMKAMMEQTVLPDFKRLYNLPVILHKHIHTAGIGESVIAEKLIDFENNLPPNFKLAYLPSIAQVKLRLTATGTDTDRLREEMTIQTEKVCSILHKHVFGFDNQTLEETIGQMLRSKKATVALAESCTGGYIAHLITSVSGSSEYFKGGIVSYSNQMKEDLLSVQPQTLEYAGAVSEETVREMIAGLFPQTGADYGIAISGIAGPGGGTPEKPVGTVWLAFGKKEKILTKKINLAGDRLLNIKVSAVVALNEFRKFLMEEG